MAESPERHGLARQLKERFDHLVEESFQQASLRCVVGGYREAYGAVLDEFDETEAFDLLPHRRRALIESQWRNLALESDGLSARAKLNRAHNSYHTVVESSSGNLLLTVSLAPGPSSVVRHAEFREEYAEVTQYELFDGKAQARVEGIYAMLIHGADDVLAPVPSFVRIAFPNRTCTEYIAQIDLLRRYPAVANNLGVSEEEIADDLDLRVRKTEEERPSA